MSKEIGSREVAEPTTDGLIKRLDMGYKKRDGDKLYLAQQTGTVFGQVEFTIKDHEIVGPDGTIFNLRSMKYNGKNGIYEYLEKCQKDDFAGRDKNRDEELN